MLPRDKCTYMYRHLIGPLSVHAHIKIIIFKTSLHFLNQCISCKKSKFPATKQEVVEAIRIADCTAWPSHENNDRIDFGFSDVEVITTHFNDVSENSDVKIDDALTEWDMIKTNLLWKAS